MTARSCPINDVCEHYCPHFHSPNRLVVGLSHLRFSCRPCIKSTYVGLCLVSNYARINFFLIIVPYGTTFRASVSSGGSKYCTMATILSSIYYFHASVIFIILVSLSSSALRQSFAIYFTPIVRPSAVNQSIEKFFQQHC